MGKDILLITQDVIRDIAEEGQVSLPSDLHAEVRLFGRGGLFDSVGLVSLVVALEQRIADDCGCAIQLADQRAMSQKHSPFRTVGSLADYVSDLIQEGNR